MKIKKFARIFLAACALALGAGQANATLMLTLSDGTNTVSIADGSPWDIAPGADAIGWSGSVGAWFFNLTGGLFSSGVGGNLASLDLVSLNASSSAGGILTVILSQTGLTSPSGPSLTATTEVGGVTSGQVAFTSAFNGAPIGSFGFSGGAFSGSTASSVDTTGGFSLTQTAVITHAGAGGTSFNLITTVPEPASLRLCAARMSQSTGVPNALAWAIRSMKSLSRSATYTRRVSGSKLACSARRA